MAQVCDNRSWVHTAFKAVFTPLQPRVVLASLLLASFLGVTVATNPTTWFYPQTILRWVQVLGVGILLGSHFWRVALAFRFPIESISARETIQTRTQLFNGVSLTLILTATILRWNTQTAGVEEFGQPIGWLGLTALLTGLVLVDSYAVRTGHKHPLLNIGLLLSLLGLLGLLTLRAIPYPFEQPLRFLVRLTHLTTVTTWLGGAAWHNVVAVALVRRRDSSPALRAQLQSFRQLVPVYILLLAVTGVYQAVTGFGTAVHIYIATLAGNLILIKALLLSLLATIVWYTRSQTP